MSAAHCARAGLAITATALASVVHAQSGPFTEAQAAAGRASYFANCAGCHLADLRGANEARPLVGPDFMRTWNARSAQELIAFLGVTMPPPPAAPGSLGPQSYVNLAAFLLQANGATAGAGELTAATSVTVGSVATGTMSEAFRASLASAAPAAATGAAGRTGITRCGSARELPARHRRHAKALAGRRLADDPRQLPGMELQLAHQITPDNVEACTLEWIWSMTDGGWNEPAPVVHDGIIYLNNMGNIIQALDARHR